MSNLEMRCQLKFLKKFKSLLTALNLFDILSEQSKRSNVKKCTLLKNTMPIKIFTLHI